MTHVLFITLSPESTLRSTIAFTRFAGTAGSNDNKPKYMCGTEARLTLARKCSLDYHSSELMLALLYQWTEKRELRTTD